MTISPELIVSAILAFYAGWVFRSILDKGDAK